MSPINLCCTMARWKQYGSRDFTLSERLIVKYLKISFYSHFCNQRKIFSSCKFIMKFHCLGIFHCFDSIFSFALAENSTVLCNLNINELDVWSLCGDVSIRFIDSIQFIKLKRIVNFLNIKAIARRTKFPNKLISFRWESRRKRVAHSTTSLMALTSLQRKLYKPIIRSVAWIAL